jgi:diadenosine tetraphosphate (Ap4A) HIT family hydrolase
MSDFALDPAFETSTLLIGRLALCEARLQRDARWPWIILLPRRAGLREIEDLSPDERHSLMDEAMAAGRAVRSIGEALLRPVEKLNLAALGNVTPQLHVHVIGRRRDDAAWPDPVWGKGAAEPYTDLALALALTAARETLGV